MVFEGAQGALLDIDHGTYPFVTSSNTVAGAACAGAGVGPRSIDEVWGIAKAYTTRVGAGPFPTELDEPLGERIRQLGRRVRHHHRTRAAHRLARPRGAPLRDAHQRADRARADQARRAHRHRPIQVGVRYLGPEGATFDDFPYHQSIVHKVQGDLVELPGWEENISGARSIEELPPNAQGYLDFVSDYLGVPIVMVGVGPARAEMIWTGAAERLGPAPA